ncbi:kelch-like protein 40 [Scaptodrosophila lebanonensis]|uniref:Kelch-like protein 40 n=1 Tax=Drosophila lebanonensis TaxID=7225 RepID=A0A6J2T886_DROLE|nr:kelch-like protein 40 [Scaptodrosophila lebanonensis]
MENSSTVWQDLQYRERMEYLLESGHLSDCSFAVFEEGTKMIIKCHKFVLISSSPVFERMFEGDFEESKTSNHIVLDDVSGQDFKKFIEYLYWHDNRCLQEYELPTLQTLIYLSKKFLVSTMVNKCLDAIKRRLAIGLDADITVDLFAYAHQIDNSDLLTSAKMVLRQNPLLYIDAEAVYDLSSDVFLKFIFEFQSLVTERKRFDVIDRYCRTQGLIGTPSTPTANNKDADTAAAVSSMKKVATTNIVLNVGESADELKTIKKDENDNEIKTKKDDPAPFKEADNENPEQEEEEKRDREKNNEFIKTLISNVQFSKMSPYDFCSGPGVSGLLTYDTKFQLLSNICVCVEKNRLLSTARP